MRSCSCACHLSVCVKTLKLQRKCWQVNGSGHRCIRELLFTKVPLLCVVLCRYLAVPCPQILTNSLFVPWWCVRQSVDGCIVPSYIYVRGVSWVHLSCRFAFAGLRVGQGRELRRREVEFVEGVLIAYSGRTFIPTFFLIHHHFPPLRLSTSSPQITPCAVVVYFSSPRSFTRYLFLRVPLCYINIFSRKNMFLTRNLAQN